MNNATAPDMATSGISTAAIASDIQAQPGSSANKKDMMGIVCSSLCLAHCLLLPMLLTTGILGSVGALLASEKVHLMLLIPVILLAVLSFPSGYKNHGSPTPVITGAAGLTLLLLALVMGEAFETTLTVMGAITLISAHLINRNLLKRSLLK